MCGRFTLIAEAQEVKKRFNIATPLKSFPPQYNIAPGEEVLAVIYDGEKRRAGPLQWGLVPFWAKDQKIGNNIINARVETLHEKPSFKHLLMRKRCLIIADSFYEWENRGDSKIVHRILNEPKTLFSFAGLWDRWEKNGETLFTCTIITKASNPFMQSIHHRMPIILSKEAEDLWLTHSFRNPEEVQQYIQSTLDPNFTSYKVSSHVNNARNKDETCIMEI